MQKNQQSTGFFRVIRTDIPGIERQLSDGNNRGAVSAVLVTVTCLIIIQSLVFYNERALVSSFCVLILLLLQLASELLTKSGKISGAITCVGTVAACVALSIFSTGSMVELLWFVLIPPLLVRLGGLMLGGLSCLVLNLFFILHFYFFSGGEFSAPYPDYVQSVFPWIFLFATVAVMALEYSRRKNLLLMYDKAQAYLQAAEKMEEASNLLVRETIMAFLNTIDAKDNYTREHSLRVARYSALLAQALGWSEEKTEELYRIALLHDIGKIGIDDSILKKKARLTDEEYSIMKKHTTIGKEILKDLAHLPNAGYGAEYHHERYDGNGYPQRLRGTQIPIEARIISIADSFDAMNSERGYSRKADGSYILNELKNQSGRQFDPELIQIFIPIAEKILGES